MKQILNNYLLIAIPRLRWAKAKIIFKYFSKPREGAIPLELKSLELLAPCRITFGADTVPGVPFANSSKLRGSCEVKGHAKDRAGRNGAAVRFRLAARVVGSLTVDPSCSTIRLLFVLLLSLFSLFHSFLGDPPRRWPPAACSHGEPRLLGLHAVVDCDTYAFARRAHTRPPLG